VALLLTFPNKLETSKILLSRTNCFIFVKRDRSRPEQEPHFRVILCTRTSFGSTLNFAAPEPVNCSRWTYPRWREAGRSTCRAADPV